MARVWHATDPRPVLASGKALARTPHPRPEIVGGQSSDAF
jgi:hypothetical protein